MRKKGYRGKYPVKPFWEKIFPPGNYPKLLKHFNEIDFAILQALLERDEGMGRGRVKEFLKSEFGLIKSSKWIGVRLKQMAKDKVLEEIKRGKYTLSPAVKNIFSEIILSQRRLLLLESKPECHYILSAVVNITYKEFIDPNLQQSILQNLSNHGFKFFMVRGEERGKIVSYSLYFQPVEELCTVFVGLTSGKALEPSDTTTSGVTVDIHINKAHTLYQTVKSFKRIPYKKFLFKLAESIAWYTLLNVLAILVDSLGLREEGVKIYEIYGGEADKKPKPLKELLR